MDTFDRKEYLENNMITVPSRTNSYSNIDSLLESEGVHSKDREIVLDAYDYSSQIVDPLDFITFDEEFYDGIKNVKIFTFNSVKGKFDFN